MKHRVCAPLVHSQKLDAETYIHTYEAPEIARDARPGHFLHIRVSHHTAPLLRRPISILWSDGQAHVEVMFKVLRTGTKLLSEKREGELVDLVGPLGTPFPYDPTHDAVAVGGGYGISPLYFLGRFHREEKNHQTLIYGARTRDQLYFTDQLRGIFDEVIYTTEDGSLGRRGYATDPLNDLMATRTEYAVYACGPTPMLSSLQAVLQRAPGELPRLWMSLENQMGCGVGACLGCVINTPEGFKTTCRSGPVFDGYEVIFAPRV
jgi:dihydroorotate dehydrogenase electron transfer subunit